jgi:hypothetical protein
MRRLLFPLLLLAACKGADAGPPAPVASAAPPPAAAAGATKMTIDRAASRVELLMDAPEEKIRGRVDGTTTGELALDLTDLGRSTGVFVVDLDALALTQVRIEKGQLGKETRSEKQNEHARTWLQISPDAPEEVRAANRRVTFTVRSVEVTGERDLRKLTGAERKVALRARGDLLLHGRPVEKTLDLEATFTFDGDRPTRVAVRTARPFAVSLREHDVKPRDTFGTLALKTLDALSSKVAKEAEVSLEVVAVPTP